MAWWVGVACVRARVSTVAGAWVSRWHKAWDVVAWAPGLRHGDAKKPLRPSRSRRPPLSLAPLPPSLARPTPPRYSSSFAMQPHPHPTHTLPTPCLHTPHPHPAYTPAPTPTRTHTHPYPHHTQAAAKRAVQSVSNVPELCAADWAPMRADAEAVAATARRYSFPAAVS